MAKKPTLRPDKVEEIERPHSRNKLLQTRAEDRRIEAIYHDGFLQTAYKLCLLGLTNAQLADFFEVDFHTISKWIEEKPGFKDALVAGREVADSNVAYSLYKRAIGCSYPDIKIFYDKDTREVIQAPFIRYLPPDPIACDRWLSTRERSRWTRSSPIKAEDKPMQEDHLVINIIPVPSSKRPSERVIDVDAVEVMAPDKVNG